MAVHSHPPPGLVIAPGRVQAPAAGPERMAVHSHTQPHSSLPPSPLQQQHSVVPEPSLSCSKKPGLPPAVCPPPCACWTEGCGNSACYKQLCAQCFIRNGMRSSHLTDPTLHTLRMMSIASTSSSAPEPGVCTAPTNTHITAPPPPNPHSQLGRRCSSHPSVNELTAKRQTSRSRVEDWVNATTGYHGQETQALSLAKTSLGLPERQVGQTEALKNDDLVVSGLCCGSLPRCEGEGCQNSVQKEGELCSLCKDVLRNFHQQGSRGNASVGQETGPNRHKCRTEGCEFYGINDSLGFCSNCNTRLRQLEEERLRRTTGPPAAQRSAAIPPPPRPALRPQGTRCMSPGCSMYGDPLQAQMCSAHYRERFPAHAASAALSPKHRRLDPSVSVQTASLEYQPGRNQGHPVQVMDPATTHSVTGATEGVHAVSLLTAQIGEPYVESLPPILTGQRPDLLTPNPPLMGRRVGGEMSGARSAAPHSSLAGELSSLGETFSRVVGQPQKCFSPYCSNFGNAQKNGLCNSCWDKYEQERMHILRFGLGEDVID